MCDFLGSFHGKCMSEDKARWKFSCWLWSQLLILEEGRNDRQGLKKDYLQRVLTNKDVELSVTVWSVIVCEPLRSKKSGMSHKSLMRFRFLSLRDYSIVITIEVNWVCDARNDTNINNELPNPNIFLSCTKGIYILSLCSRIGDCPLLGTVPTYNVVIQAKHKS